MEEALKKVFVIARILKVVNQDTAGAISIYNNTQTPINSRDMAANNDEQKELHSRLLSDKEYPMIFMEIRRGSKPPKNFNRLFKHRQTTNEVLAQLAYAGFLLQPYTAKERKSALFNNDIMQDTYTMNEIYHKVFHFDNDDASQCGVLLQKTKNEIDELLFTQQLYKECKKYLKIYYEERINNCREQLKNAEQSIHSDIERIIKQCEYYLATNGVCLFYFITTYYVYQTQFRGDACLDKRYDYDKFYENRNYRQEMVKRFSEFLLIKTISILVKTAEANGKAGNINNWIKISRCQDEFKRELINDIMGDLSGSS